jgi:hypothetical protein
LLKPPPVKKVVIEGPVRPAVERPKAPKEKEQPLKPAAPTPTRVEIPLQPAIPGIERPPVVPTLAVTGFDAMDLALVGSTVLAFGLITVLAARRRATT